MGLKHLINTDQRLRSSVNPATDIPFNVRLVSQEFVQRLESLDLREIGVRHSDVEKSSGKFFIQVAVLMRTGGCAHDFI